MNTSRFLPAALCGYPGPHRCFLSFCVFSLSDSVAQFLLRRKLRIWRVSICMLLYGFRRTLTGVALLHATDPPLPAGCRKQPIFAMYYLTNDKHHESFSDIRYYINFPFYSLYAFLTPDLQVPPEIQCKPQPAGGSVNRLLSWQLLLSLLLSSFPY